MRLMVGEGGDHIEISELYCGVALSTNEGEKIGICQRDGIFEISILKSKSGNPIRIMSAAPKAVELAATTANTGGPKFTPCKACSPGQRLVDFNSLGYNNCPICGRKLRAGA